jgi:hypothetical protein
MPHEHEDQFAAAYRAYLVAIKKAWAEVDVDTLMESRSVAPHYTGDCAGTWSCLGSLATLGTVTGATLGTFGSFGTVAVKPEE